MLLNKISSKIYHIINESFDFNDNVNNDLDTLKISLENLTKEELISLFVSIIKKELNIDFSYINWNNCFGCQIISDSTGVYIAINLDYNERMEVLNKLNAVYDVQDRKIYGKTQLRKYKNFVIDIPESLFNLCKKAMQLLHTNLSRVDINFNDERQLIVCYSDILYYSKIVANAWLIETILLKISD